MAQQGSYNPINSPINTENYSTNNRSFFSKVLKDLSNYGMNFEDKVLRNRVAIAANEDPTAAISGGVGMYDFFAKRAMASYLSKKSISYLQLNYQEKKRVLREYSVKDNIRDFISTICDESIVYDEDKPFCRPKNLPDSYPREVKDKYQEVFERIMNKFKFNDGNVCWNYFRDFIIDGFLAFEIVYDDKQKNIVDFVKLNSETLIPGYDEATGRGVWIQYPEDPRLRKILLDSQIIYISYSSHNEYNEMSYVEGLIKPYNQLKLLEQTRIMFNMANASIYQKFVIPVKGLSKSRGEEEIGELIANYSEEVEWDDEMGTVTINGSKHLPYNKQLWFPEGDSGTPNMELVSPDGHNLNESDMLTWFFNALKRESKIPFSRFDKDNGGGSVYMDATEMTRDEIKFSNFIGRLRAIFKEIIVKPLKLQMLIEFPEYRGDDSFINDINIQFSSNDHFEKMKELSNFQKRLAIASEIQAFAKPDGTPYFHIEYIVDKYLELTQEEKDENNSYFIKYPMSGMAGSGGSGNPGGSPSGPSSGPSSPSNGPETGGSSPEESPEGGPEPSEESEPGDFNI